MAHYSSSDDSDGDSGSHNHESAPLLASAGSTQVRSGSTGNLGGQQPGPFDGHGSAHSSTLPWYHPTNAAFQWTGLLVICFMTFGTSVAYDSVGALGPLLRQHLHTSAEGLADLYSVYHLPNLVLVFFGGLLSDRIGTRKAGVIFSALVVLGVVLVASGQSLSSMLLGRFVFGIGSESLSVVQLGIIAHWFSTSPTPPSMGLACALSLTVNRLGTLVAFDALPIIGESHAGLTAALWFVVFVCVFGLALVLLWIVMDVQLAPHLPFSESSNGSNGTGSIADEEAFGSTCRSSNGNLAAQDSIVERVRSFSTSYWLLVLICVSHYAALISYSDFSSDFLHENWGYTAEQAGRIQSTTTMISLLTTPFFGQLADRYGKRVTMMLTGSSLLIPAHLIVLMHFNPLFSNILQGFGSAMVCASMWPSIALVCTFYFCILLCCPCAPFRFIHCCLLPSSPILFACVLLSFFLSFFLVFYALIFSTACTCKYCCWSDDCYSEYCSFLCSPCRR
jgi:MFS family permease